MSHAWQHPAIFHVNGIGDYMLALPAVRAIVERHGTKASLISSSGPHNLVYGDLPSTVSLIEVETPDGRGFDPEMVLPELERCDGLLSFSSWWSSDLEVLVSSFRDRGLPTVGFTTDFETTVEARDPEHAFDLHFRLARSVVADAQFAHYTHPWPLDSKIRRQAGNLREQIGSARLLVIHSETTRSDKEWPVECWRALFDRLMSEHRDVVVLILDYVDRRLAPAGASRVIACPGVGLELALALVQTADGFLGVDSCLLHAADFGRVPGVGLFGATSPARWGFRFSPHRHVIADGMSAISVQEVFEAVSSLLRESAESAKQSEPTNEKVSLGRVPPAALTITLR